MSITLKSNIRRLFVSGCFFFWASNVLAQIPVAPTPAVQPVPSSPPSTPKVSPPDLGDQGTFVVDQISGFRGRVGGGVNYYGPVGLAYNNFSTDLKPSISGSTIVNSTASINSWSLWLAPSLDYFLVKNLSIGGLFSIDTTFGKYTSQTTSTTAGTGSSTPIKTEGDLPTVTSFTLMPRIGYFVRFTDRISLWPRLGIGFFSGSNAIVDNSAGSTTVSTQTTTVRGMIFQLDAGLIYQVTDNVFFRMAPSVSFIVGGSGSLNFKGSGAANTDRTGDGSAFQFELTTGFGANFSL